MIFNGDRTSGNDIRKQNVQAAVSVANIVRTSLGPVGLDKMMVDEVGDVTITNDGATILKLLDVEHPAAKVLVELADLQDQEVCNQTLPCTLLMSSAGVLFGVRASERGAGGQGALRAYDKQTAGQSPLPLRVRRESSGYGDGPQAPPSRD